MEVSGELTFETAAHFKESLQRVLESPQAGVLLDFNRLTYIASPALVVIVQAWNVLGKRGIPIALCGLHGHVKKVLEVVRLTEKLPVFSSRVAAIEHLVGQP